VTKNFFLLRLEIASGTGKHLNISIHSAITSSNLVTLMSLREGSCPPFFLNFGRLKTVFLVEIFLNYNI